MNDNIFTGLITELKQAREEQEALALQKKELETALQNNPEYIRICETLKEITSKVSNTEKTLKSGLTDDLTYTPPFKAAWLKGTIDITCDYCVFDGENFIDVMKFLKAGEVTMRLSQDKEKVLVVGSTEMRRGDVVVRIPEIGSVGSRYSFLTAGKYTQLLNDQLERVLSDPDLKDNPAVVLLQKQVASLEERIGDYGKYTRRMF